MKVLVIAGCGVLMSIVAIVGTAWGTTYNWPDFVHTNHGFPFVWGTHTLNTIAGPADKWSVDISMLTLDLSVWLAALILTVTIVASYLRK